MIRTMSLAGYGRVISSYDRYRWQVTFVKGRQVYALNQKH